MSVRYPRIASSRTVEEFREHLRAVGASLPVDDRVLAAPASPLALRLDWKGHPIGNRWCILPMEGWDGTRDGQPTETTRRRWKRFGGSGAKLIWGCEAVAVCREGRGNPHQLWIRSENRAEFEAIREDLVRAHEERFGRSDDLLVGLQLTHSGRFCRPDRDDRLAPHILYRHPILDRRFGIPADHPLLGDDEIRRIVEQFVEAARLSSECGYDFVDIKHCHGYLGHEFLSAVDRDGPYGGSLENRTRFLREVVEGIRSAAPTLDLAVRVSAFDTIPYRAADHGGGEPEPCEGEYRHAFGCDPANPTRYRLSETEAFLEILQGLDIDLVCVSGGSPYYCPHVQRPALFPPSDGYAPPEDPLAGVARQIEVTAALKRRFPGLLMVGSAYTYLQEYLPHVAQAAVREGWTDFVGLGRMALAYPDLPADVLEGRPLRTATLCRTFSDCTTAPRMGMPSGCYPLDPFYKDAPEAARLLEAKRKR